MLLTQTCTQYDLTDGLQQCHVFYTAMSQCVNEYSVHLQVETSAALSEVQHSIATVEASKHAARRRLFAGAAQQLRLGSPLTATSVHSCTAEDTARLGYVMQQPAQCAAVSELEQRGSSLQATGMQASRELEVQDMVPVVRLAHEALDLLWRALGAPRARLTEHRPDAFQRWCSPHVGGTHELPSTQIGASHDATPFAWSACHAGTEAGLSPYQRTTLHERDVILTERIWLAATERGAKSVVAVVGASHVLGIMCRWQHAGTSASQAEAQEYLERPAPEQADPAAQQKGRLVNNVAFAMEAAAIGSALYLPSWLLKSRLPTRWRWAPSVAAAGALCSASVCADLRRRHVAQVVQAIALHQDAMDATTTA
jgi:hypothetical protein